MDFVLKNALLDEDEEKDETEIGETDETEEMGKETMDDEEAND